MGNLEQSLQQHHLIVLRMLGEWWEMDLIGKDKDECATLLAEQLQQVDLPTEMLYLQQEEAEAMRALAGNGGRMTVGEFGRNFGTVREMGPAKLEREEPWFNPDNVAEALWYRGFLYRSFDETDDGLIEFYYLPTELLNQFDLPPAAAAVVKEDVEPFIIEPTDDSPVEVVVPPTVIELSAKEPASFDSADTLAVDDLTTMLVFAQRNQLNGKQNDWLSNYLLIAERSRRSLLLTLAWELGMLKRGDDEIRPTRTAVDWLREGRESQIALLIDKWTDSQWNALRHTPTVKLEGEPPNDPASVRRAIIELLPRDDQWFNVAALTALIKQENADFQRPDGNYESWYIRDENDQYLRGFDTWEQVEGRLIHFVLTTVMFWLGLVDRGEDKTTVRLTARGVAWLEGRTPSVKEATIPPIVQADASVIVPRHTNRFTRFQTARFAEPQPYSADKPYLYRITPQSLALAKEQGIDPTRVLAFLQKAVGSALPASTKRAIERWGEKGTEGKLAQVTVLRVADEKVIEILRKNAKTKDLLGESIGALAVVVHDMEKLRHVTAQLGLLLELS